MGITVSIVKGTDTDLKMQIDFPCTPKHMCTLHETQPVHYGIFLNCDLKKTILIKAQVGILL